MATPGTTAAVLVDVDGVVSPYPSDSSDRAHWPARSWHEALLAGTLTLEWSGLLIDRLRAVAERPGVEMLWCTTWQHRAPRILGPAIGLGEDWPWLDDATGEWALTFHWWKAERARDALAAHDRVVWMDDFVDAWRDEAARVTTTEPRWWEDERLLALSPDPLRGLEPGHLDQVEAFLDTP